MERNKIISSQEGQESAESHPGIGQSTFDPHFNYQGEESAWLPGTNSSTFHCVRDSQLAKVAFWRIAAKPMKIAKTSQIRGREGVAVLMPPGRLT
jgi:hypothetical protein